MFSAFFIHRPKFALVISIVLTLMGILALMQLPTAEYPQISPPKISIQASYPGASAEVVEQTVGVPIEEAVNGVEEMIYMSSRSSNDGTYTLDVTFETGSDADMALVRVQNRVKLAENRLPSDVRTQGLSIDKVSPDILQILSFYSPDNSLDENFIANYLKLNVTNRLKRVNGVSDARILGSEYSMRLWLDPNRMSQLAISSNDVFQALQEQNVQAAVGKVGSPPFVGNVQTQYTLQAKGRLTDVEEFENIIIRTSGDGSTVYLRDIARVELGQMDYSITGKFGDNPATNIAMYLLPEANALEAGENILAVLEELRPNLPEGMDYAIGYDTTRYISVAIGQVVESLIEAVLLVILVTFIFLGSFRMAIIPAVAIPVSLVATFAVLLVMGISLNTIALFGLVLAIGIVVDDAILVIENVDRHLIEDPGMSAKEATLITMKEITGPVISTTLVLLAVFIPVALLPGITGEMYRQFSITICVAVLFSSLNALTLSPALCGLLLKGGEKKQAAWFIKFNAMFDKVRDVYGNTVAHLVKKIFLVGMVFIAIAVGTAFGFINAPTGFVPSEDKGVMMVNIQLPDAASLARTKDTVEKVAKMSEKIEGVESVTSISGFNLLSGAAQSNSGVIFVVLEHWDERPGKENNVFSIANQLNQQAYFLVPEAQVYALSPPSIPGMGAVGGMEMVLEDTLGRSHQELANVLNAFIAEANKKPQLQGVFSTFRASVPQYFVEVDRQKVKDLGVQLNDVFGTLQTNLGSMYINDFNKFGQSFRVIMQADAAYRASIEDLDILHVKSGNGDMVPLSTFMEIKPILGPDLAERYNLYRSAVVRGNPAPGYSSGEAIKVMEQLAEENLPDGFQVEWTGMTYQEIQAGNLAVYAFALAFVFIYLFLVAQYESWSIPIAILLVVPVAISGTVLTILMVPQLQLNLYAQIGIVLLIGMAAKNAILIVEFAKSLHETDNKPIQEAAETAARLRFRAVNMTAFSFILGILPLVTAQGAGMFSQVSLGTTVLSGMLAVLLLGTFFIPVFYVMVQGTREKLKSKLGFGSARADVD